MQYFTKDLANIQPASGNSKWNSIHVCVCFVETDYFMACNFNWWADIKCHFRVILHAPSIMHRASGHLIKKVLTQMGFFPHFIIMLGPVKMLSLIRPPSTRFAEINLLILLMSQFFIYKTHPCKAWLSYSLEKQFVRFGV